MFWLVYSIVVTATAVSLGAGLVAVYRRYRALRSRLGPARRVDADKVARIIELYRMGYSYRRIARTVGVSHSTVARIVKKYRSITDVPDSEPGAERTRT